MKSYTFWFCSNKIYNSSSVKHAPWWRRPFLLMGCFHEATCIIHGCDSAEEALEHAVASFREEGFSRQIMGHEY